MTVGTEVITYDTQVSPVFPGEETRSQVQLTGTIGDVSFHEGTVISSAYRLRTDLTAEVRLEDGKYVVVDYQVDEYGIGNSLEEAQQDLLDSMVDYLASLEKREHRLADRELYKLQLLRGILVRR